MKVHLNSIPDGSLVDIDASNFCDSLKFKTFANSVLLLVPLPGRYDIAHQSFAF